MEQQTPGTGPQSAPGAKGSPRPRVNPSTLWIALISIVVISFLLFMRGLNQAPEIAYSRFLDELAKGNVSQVEITGDQAYGKLKSPIEITIPESAGKEENKLKHGSPQPVSLSKTRLMSGAIS